MHATWRYKRCPTPAGRRGECRRRLFGVAVASKALHFSWHRLPSHPEPALAFANSEQCVEVGCHSVERVFALARYGAYHARPEQYVDDPVADATALQLPVVPPGEDPFMVSVLPWKSPMHMRGTFADVGYLSVGDPWADPAIVTALRRWDPSFLTEQQTHRSGVSGWGDGTARSGTARTTFRSSAGPASSRRPMPIAHIGHTALSSSDGHGKDGVDDDDDDDGDDDAGGGAGAVATTPVSRTVPKTPVPVLHLQTMTLQQSPPARAASSTAHPLAHPTAHAASSGSDNGPGRDGGYGGGGVGAGAAPLANTSPPMVLPRRVSTQLPAQPQPRSLTRPQSAKQLGRPVGADTMTRVGSLKDLLRARRQRHPRDSTSGSDGDGDGDGDGDNGCGRPEWTNALTSAGMSPAEVVLAFVNRDAGTATRSGSRARPSSAVSTTRSNGWTSATGHSRPTSAVSGSRSAARPRTLSVSSDSDGDVVTVDVDSDVMAMPMGVQVGAMVSQSSWLRVKGTVLSELGGLRCNILFAIPGWCLVAHAAWDECDSRLALCVSLRGSLSYPAGASEAHRRPVQLARWHRHGRRGGAVSAWHGSHRHRDVGARTTTRQPPPLCSLHVRGTDPWCGL